MCSSTKLIRNDCLCVFQYYFVFIGIVVHENDAETDLTEIKQQLESTIGSEELQQKLTKARSRTSITHSESGSGVDQRSLNGSLRRQQSTDSQKSANLLRSTSIKETLPMKTGEKIIEVEKAETGSVSFVFAFLNLILTENFLFSILILIIKHFRFSIVRLLLIFIDNFKIINILSVQVKLKVYAHYLKSIGWFLSISTIVMNAIFQSFSIGSNIWIAVWSDDNTTVVNNTADPAKRDLYVGVYGALGLGQGT